MKRPLLALLIGIGLLAAGLAAWGFCVVAPGEIVVVRRLGHVVEPPWGPGLHWHFPGGIDRLDRIRTDAVRQFAVGQAGPAGVDQEPSAGEFLTGDLNLLRVEATVQYRVADPVAHALRSEQAEDLIARAAEAGLVRSLARRGVDATLRSDRGRIAQEVRDDLQSAADGLRLGILVLGVSLTDARPPVEVAADFAEAQSAESRRDDRINVARTHESVQLATASSRGDALRERAKAEASRALITARADADRFLALLAEVARSRELTVRRLYIETVQTLLERVRRKLILPTGNSLDLTVLGPAGQPAAPPLQPRRPDPSRPRDSDPGGRKGRE
jgi:membrane protease subunit HflK